jgi:glyoxylase-like metal-dependent hydrolase (beta-lactamase superfamily II)
VIFRAAGRIDAGLYMLGHAAAPVYLLDGEHPVLIDAGLTLLTDRYINAIRQVLGDRQPAVCLLTHSHFDHCGAAAAFKAAFPALQIGCAPRAAEVLRRPHVLQRIRALNRAAEQSARALGVAVNRPDAFEPFAVDFTLVDGDHYPVSGDVHLVVLETPGHTRDCLSYYAPARRLLFSSEAAGVPDATGYIFSDCLVDYDLYLASLKKLCSLDVAILCPAHICAYTGADARRFLQRAPEHCDAFRHSVEEALEVTGGDLDAVIRRIRRWEYDGKPGAKQPEAAYLLNLEARVRAVQQRMERQAGGGR